MASCVAQLHVVPLPHLDQPAGMAAIPNGKPLSDPHRNTVSKLGRICKLINCNTARHGGFDKVKYSNVVPSWGILFVPQLLSLTCPTVLCGQIKPMITVLNFHEQSACPILW